MNVTEQLKALVEIPSFVTKDNDESLLGEYLTQRLNEILPSIKIEKQFIEGTPRFNIYTGKCNADLMVIGHIDTVQPSQGGLYDPLESSIEGNKIYGLGAYDMKGSLAAFLVALENKKDEIDIDKLSCLFYVDEEYDFLGMKRFLQTTKKLGHKLIVSLDGTSTIRSGCRGLIEIDLQIYGKSGHSSKPFLGNNAILATTEMVNTLSKIVNRNVDTNFGFSTLNLAYLRGGKVAKKNGKIEWFREGNIIPDYVECTIEVRTTSKEVNANYIVKEIKKIVKVLNIEVNVERIRHDIVPWKCAYDSVALEDLKAIYDKVKLPFKLANVAFSGYIDIGMLEEISSSPKYTIGVEGDNAHAPDEFAYIDSLLNAQKLYEEMLTIYCKLEE